MNLALWIVFCFLTSAPLALADQSSILEAHEARKKAANEYYLELKKLKNPTPDQIQSLKKSIIEPAELAVHQAILNTQKDEQKKMETEATKDREATVKKVTAAINSNPSLPESSRKTVLSAVNKAMKGDFSEIDKMRPTPSPSASSSAPSKPGTPAKAPSPTVAPVVKEEIVIDGSAVPKEIEFSGPQKKRDPRLH